ncbi:MAG TPA: methyltransferase domain-containing protein [Alphaproteobacteria bacterium]|nr:methyltransferase domain-containing protein [Alphaproteobacteria bacterium]
MDERQRWNTRYAAQGQVAATSPNPFLCDHLELLPRGRALELAMGDGHNAIYLARHGFSVSGIDISDVAVSRALQLAQRTGVQLEAQVRDLTAIALPAATYDVVVCFYYLQRDLFPQIIGALKPGGMVVYETYTQEQAQLGHPTNPAYLLQPNELLWAFKALRVRVYREVVISGPKAVASLIGEKVV